MNIQYVIRRADGKYLTSVAPAGWTSILERAEVFEMDSDHASTCCLGARVGLSYNTVRIISNSKQAVEILQVRERKIIELVDHSCCEGCKRTKCGRS